MFCNNCGTQNQDGAPFCTNCGAPLQAANPAPAVAPQPTANPVVAPVAPAPKAKKGFNTKLLIPVVAVVLVVAIIIGAIALFGGDPKDKYYVSKAVYVSYDASGNVTNKETYEYYNEDDEFPGRKEESNGQVTGERKVERDKKGRITKITEKSSYGDKVVFRFDEYEKEDGIYVSEAKNEQNGQTRKIKLGYKKDVIVLHKEFYNDQPISSMERDGKIVTEKEYSNGEVVGTKTTELNKNDYAIRVEYKSDVDSNEDYVVTYERDKKDNVLEYVRKDSAGEVVEKYVAEYDKNGNCTSRTEYDAEGEVTSKWTGEYNKYDICIKGESRDENDEITSYYKLKKESKDKIVVEHYNGEDTLISFTEYTIEKGKLTEAKSYDGVSEELRSTTLYNKHGLVIEERSYYNEDGKLSSKTTYEYAKK